MKIALGPFSAVLDGMALRWLSWRGLELLRGAAFVVRGAGWETYVPMTEVVAIESSPNREELLVRGTIAAPRLICELRVAVTPGRVLLDATASAAEDFPTNRAGFVILHGEACAGLGVTVDHAAGATTEGRFPELISPHQPFTDIRAIAHAPHRGIAVRVVMHGETFEMEDHRNWSDAGFKTYSRPLAATRPFVIAAGSVLSQRVEVCFEASPDPAGVVLPPERAALVARPTGRVPRIVRGAPAARFAELPPDARMMLAETSTGDDLAEFARCLAARERPGAVLLTGVGDRLRAIEAVADAGAIAVLLLADATAEGVAHARRCLPRARIGAGSDRNFAEFNRNPPPSGIDFAFWAVSATVHASDDSSIMETLHVLVDQVATARALVPGVPLWVGPIGIGRHWANDPRDSGPLGAAFILGHLAAWTSTGIESVIVPPGIHIPALLHDDMGVVVHPKLVGLAEQNTAWVAAPGEDVVVAEWAGRTHTILPHVVTALSRQG